ncbi:site-specific integrase [Vibrio parahaemolyticus]|uniref:site-specific integrase n=1 Tax=Vibrio harveyi group TaxID=717610 RepID=UPI000405F9BD|nr:MULTISPECIES: site-specific integrase [Vibrio harveyi group]EJF9992958.1 site-specific integrase [Vibrio parahaemolyticus]EJG0198093.1 site-specific integrase [Vibrio parahaemolyticus]EJG0578696.1 site-specific integrase [Vibrio parahaemolyticus]ELB2048720.1 site-specific integrase [Vibrio parahaemolyticus]ELB2189189.1 site-specific integrase [Vibrio parahaemolyticus]
MKIDSLKIDVKDCLPSDENDPSINWESSLFLHGNGEVNWFATDFLMSDTIPNRSKKTAKGMIRYFLEYLECYENWKYNDIQGKPLPIGLISDSHLYDYVQYIEDDIGLNRNAIANRVRMALRFLEYVQKYYHLSYTLIAIANTDGEYFTKGLVNAERKISPYGKRYLHHDCIPHGESYGSRSPITEAAIESLYDDLDTLEAEGDLYRFEFFSTLIGLLEATGIRVSEAANIDTHTIEVLRAQVNASLSGKAIGLDEIISLNKLTINTQSLQAAQAIYRKSALGSANDQLVWIKIKTTKGNNKDKFRIIPISFTTAQYLIRFYDDYVVNELDRINKGLAKVNRAKFGKLFVHPSSHLPMSGIMISRLFYDVFSRKFKSKHKRSPHLFRHRFITLLVLQQLKALKANIGGTQLANLILNRIKGLTGHASIKAMLHYVELAEAELYEDEDESEVFDSVTRDHLVAELGAEHVAALEAGLRLKKAEQAFI